MLPSDLAKYDCDRSYLTSAIENKQRVIAFEDSCVDDVKSILDKFEADLTAMINTFIQSRGRNVFKLSDRADREAFVSAMKAITAQMQEALLEKEIEVTVQTYEMVVNDQIWLLQDYLDSLSEQAVGAVKVTQGGEQATNGENSLKKPRLTADKAKSLVSSRRVKKTVDERITNAVKEFEVEFMQAFDDSTNSNTGTSSIEVIEKMRKSLERKVRKQAEFSMRSGIQSIEETAYMDVWHENDWVRPTEFQRVEVLDGHVCLECMFVDTTYNDKPLGLLHYNCRGMDIPIYYDSKGRRIHVDGIKYSRRRLTFDERFARLTQKEQRRMLGKGKFALYKDGKLKPSEFLSYGNSLTLKEAERHVALKSIRKYIKTPDAAEKVMGMLEEGFPKVTRMNLEQLKAYESVVGEQRKIISFVPKKNFSKDKSYGDYVSDLDQKMELVRLRYKSLKGGE